MHDDGPTEITEERAAELRAWEREEERARRREFRGTVAAMVAGSALGCVIMAQGFRATDREIGEIWVAGGILVGQAAILVVLVRAWLRQRDG